MTNILDRVARISSSAQYSQFRPATPREFFAMRLAQKLNDAAAIHHYIELVDRYSEALMLLAYRRAKNTGGQGGPARSFHVELERLNGRNGNIQTAGRLAAIRIERRAIAVAIFTGDRLAYTPLVRQLSSSRDKALGSAATFINRLREKCSFTTAALETVPLANGGVQRHLLAEIICKVLNEQTVAIWQVSKQDVLSAFGRPPLRFRKQLREVASTIWPDANGGFGAPLIKDALALGLYCQVEYQFNP